MLGLLKVPGGSRVRCILQGERWLYFGSHWLGRVLLCAGDGCPACRCGASRVMGYRLAVWCDGERRVLYVLEASSGAIAGLDQSAKFHGLDVEPGLEVEIGRKGKRSPLRFEAMRLTATMLQPGDAEVTLVNALAVLYGLPVLMPGEDAAAWAQRVQPVASSHCAAAVRAAG